MLRANVSSHARIRDVDVRPTGPVTRIVFEPAGRRERHERQMLTRELSVAAALCDNAATKVVTITGAGRFFCAGGDLKAMAASPIRARSSRASPRLLPRAVDARAHRRGGDHLGQRDRSGGGLQPGRDRGHRAGRGVGEVHHGVHEGRTQPDGSSSYYLPRLIGLRRTQGTDVLTNRTLTAAEAPALGSADRGGAGRRSRGPDRRAGPGDGEDVADVERHNVK